MAAGQFTVEQRFSSTGTWYLNKSYEDEYDELDENDESEGEDEY